jgi:UDP-N-acetylglucosamine:LPS N-acetylglucosamine transferase
VPAPRLRRDGIEVAVLDHLDLLPFPLRRALTDGYAVGVGRVPSAFEWLFQRLEDSRLVLAAADLLCRLAGRRLATAVADADVVVSTYPLASRSLGQLVRRGRVRAASVTYLTDPAPHRTWVHPDIGLHLTVTEPTALAGQRRYGVPMRPSGPLVPPAFAETSPDGRQRLRGGLGLGSADVAVLLTTGSIGLGDVEPTAAAVRSAGAVPIVLCGRNTRLRQTLEASGYLALGWRDDVPALMAACDVLVHNAGGLSLTEALVVGLPCVTFAPIAGHGRANAALLDECGLVPWARTPAQLAQYLRRVTSQKRQPLSQVQQPAAAVIADLARDAAAGRGLGTGSMEPAALGA